VTPVAAAPRRENRGPSAGPENRRALIAAAAEVFAEKGITAPLSAVAKRAGVGQGSLYRHFPDRTSLALAAFEDNVAAIEALADEPGTDLDSLLDLITDQMIGSVAFVSIVSLGAADARLPAVGQRVVDAIAPAVEQARKAGRLRRDATADDVMLAIGMASSFVAQNPGADRRAVAESCWALLDRALRP
jgi:AcrR family transcriptional regulator